MKSLTEQVILITGAGRGVGKTLAETLSAEGAIIAAVDISPLLLDELEASIRGGGGQCRTYVSDMAKKRFVQGIIETVFEDWGKIDVLINAGYVNPKGGILDLDDWDWQRSLDVNLSGVFYALQAFGRVAKEQPDGGGVVNLIPQTGNPSLTVSTFALLRLTHEAAAQFAAHNIRVNAICPTEMRQEDLAKHAIRYCGSELTGQVAAKNGERPISEFLLYN